MCVFKLAAREGAASMHAQNNAQTVDDDDEDEDGDRDVPVNVNALNRAAQSRQFVDVGWLVLLAHTRNWCADWGFEDDLELDEWCFEELSLKRIFIICI